MIILDTDVLTLIEFGHGAEYERCAERLDAVENEPIAVTIISFEEQCRGWLARIAVAKEPAKEVKAYARLSLLLKFYQQFQVLQYDAGPADSCTQLKRIKLRVGTMDLKIAAIALAHNALLLSRNLRDFQKIPGLRVEDWTLEETEE